MTEINQINKEKVIQDIEEMQIALNEANKLHQWVYAKLEGIRRATEDD